MATWLQEKWQETKLIRREVVWRMMPETILDYLESNNALVLADDINFLIEEASQPIAEGKEAVRLLGLLVEDKYAAPELVVPFLINLLNHSDAAVRSEAIHSIWAIADPSLKDKLIEARVKETHPTNCRTLDHVIQILDRQLDFLKKEECH